MAYPAIDPTGFINVTDGLRLEAERLHTIAEAELERRSEAYQRGPAGNTASDWTANLRRRLRVDELAAAANPARPEPAGDNYSHPGYVLYEDVSGTTYRKPVAHWIAFMTMRLRAAAGAELNRQFNAACRDEPDQDANALYDRLRQYLRIDALNDLAFQSREIFEASREYAVGHRWRVLGAAAAKPDPELIVLEA
ncbi:hypothetical protein G3T14_23165 [Methylobacterium sp. BTF04]|uniref:hypothetical protein n=1 Tax=Methylobacterium sp. BTF04 TaxID=2708300 RepID=UPI0013D43635|nr:hypothetical protein [Methylobacterium sp. BTF04]NEU14951.1 hypothetical protein [Methylobacterium sp. BTF04]